MCAINPKQEYHFTLSVYTAHEMSFEDFLNLVMEKAINVEQNLNADARLRWHIKGGTK